MPTTEDWIKAIQLRLTMLEFIAEVCLANVLAGLAPDQSQALKDDFTKPRPLHLPKRSGPMDTDVLAAFQAALRAETTAFVDKVASREESIRSTRN